MFDKGFGEKKVFDWNQLKEGATLILPNNKLELERDALLSQWDQFPSVVENLLPHSESKLTLSAYQKFKNLEFEAVIRDGETPLALKAIIKDSPYFFPTPDFFIRLKKENRSLVRFVGDPEPNYFTVEIDTRTEEFSWNEAKLKFKKRTFKQEYTERETFVSDFVTRAQGLIGMRREGYDDVITAITSKYTPLFEFLQKNFEIGKPPFEINTMETCFYQGEEVVAGTRMHREKGRELFLTKKGFILFSNKQLSIIRAKRSTKEEKWTTLEVLFHLVMENELE